MSCDLRSSRSAPAGERSGGRPMSRIVRPRRRLTANCATVGFFDGGGRPSKPKGRPARAPSSALIDAQASSICLLRPALRRAHLALPGPAAARSTERDPIPTGRGRSEERAIEEDPAAICHVEHSTTKKSHLVEEAAARITSRPSGLVDLPSFRHCHHLLLLLLSSSSPWLRSPPSPFCPAS